MDGKLLNQKCNRKRERKDCILVMIPAIETLKQHPNWVLRNKNKVPICPRCGQYASHNNPDTWGTYEEVRKSWRKWGTVGAGWVFTKEAGIVGIDLDKCLGQYAMSGEQYAILESVKSYTEYSPSQNGLHVLAYGDLPQAIKRDSIGIEIYSEKRYFTITGKPFNFDNTPLTIEDCSKAIKDIYEFYKPKETAVKKRPFSSSEKVSIEKVERALSYIPTQLDYIDWIRVCAGVCHEFGEQGIAIIERWSAGYIGEVKKKFNSFKRDGGTMCTIGTVFYMAGEYGYPLNAGERSEL